MNQSKEASRISQNQSLSYTSICLIILDKSFFDGEDPLSFGKAHDKSDIEELASQLRKFIKDKNYQKAVDSLREIGPHKDTETRNAASYELKMTPSASDYNKLKHKNIEEGPYEVDPQTNPYYRDHTYLRDDALSQRRVTHDDIKPSEQTKRNIAKFADGNIVNLLGEELAYNSIQNNIQKLQNSDRQNINNRAIYPMPILANAGPPTNMPVTGADGIIRLEAFRPSQPAVVNTPIIYIPSATVQVPINVPVKDVQPSLTLVEPVLPIRSGEAVGFPRSIHNPFGYQNPLPATPYIPERGMPQAQPRYVPAPTLVLNRQNYPIPTDLASNNSHIDYRKHRVMQGAYNVGSNDHNNNYMQRRYLLNQIKIMSMLSVKLIRECTSGQTT